MGRALGLLSALLGVAALVPAVAFWVWVRGQYAVGIDLAFLNVLYELPLVSAAFLATAWFLLKR